MSYMIFSSEEKHLFKTLFILSRASDNSILLKILGGRMHGPSRHLKFGGPPPVPLRSPPLRCMVLYCIVLYSSIYIAPLNSHKQPQANRRFWFVIMGVALQVGLC